MTIYEKLVADGSDTTRKLVAEEISGQIPVPEDAEVKIRFIDHGWNGTMDKYELEMEADNGFHKKETFSVEDLAFLASKKVDELWHNEYDKFTKFKNRENTRKWFRDKIPTIKSFCKGFAEGCAIMGMAQIFVSIIKLIKNRGNR